MILFKNNFLTIQTSQQTHVYILNEISLTHDCVSNVKPTDFNF